MARKVKYMGSADTRTLSTGENWGGRLAKPLENTVTFDKSNGRIIDVEDAGISEAAVQLLLEDGDFVDVTEADVIPAGLNERLFQGVPETPFVSRADGKGKEIYATPVYNPSERIEDLTADELKDRLGDLGLSRGGSKAELADRLNKAQTAVPQSTNPPVNPINS